MKHHQVPDHKVCTGLCCKLHNLLLVNKTEVVLLHLLVVVFLDSVVVPLHLVIVALFRLDQIGVLLSLHLSEVRLILDHLEVLVLLFAVVLKPRFVEVRPDPLVEVLLLESEAVRYLQLVECFHQREAAVLAVLQLHLRVRHSHRLLEVSL